MIKEFLKYIILFLIQFIEKIEHKNLELNENDISKKIIETIDISNENIKIKTDTGYKQITHIHKTQPYTIYKIKTISGKTLECADNHILFDRDMNQVFCKNLKEFDIIQTKDGLEEIISIIKSPFKVSMFDVTVNSDDHRFYTNDILSHNTITSSFYIMWYACFNSERNILVVANKEATTKEIIHKIQSVYDNLPFFLKPGLVVRNVKSLEFENECRLVGSATTATAGISFTIHLLYADEFAHIPANIKNDFHRSVIPTLSSSEISQFIITSTPNGQELFHKLYSRAIPWRESNYEIKKRHPMVSMITYWDAVPGRGEEFKSQQIELLGGSLEGWNQEFECSFLKTNDLFLNLYDIKFLEKIKTEYIHQEIIVFDDRNIDYRNLLWDPKFNIDSITDNDRFVISIDTSDGIGQDYTSINIFKLEPISLVQIRKLDECIDENDFFRLRQIGIFHSNKTSIDDVIKFLIVLLFDFFYPDHVRIVLEVNFKGELIYNIIQKHKDAYSEMFVYTKPNEHDDKMIPGLRLNKHIKNTLVNNFRRLFKRRKIIFNESQTISEAKGFGLNKKGTFSAQSGHDDLIMSCINIAAFFGTTEQSEMVEDIYDFLDSTRINAINKKINIENIENNDMTYYGLFKEYL